MAEKKIFTSLAFQSGAKLIAPKVEARTPLATLTDPTDSNYYTGSAGQLAYNNGNIWVNNDSTWTKLLNHATTATISGEFTFDRVDGNNAGIAPFIIGSNSNNVLVTGLNADKLDGYDARNALNDGTTHSIPRRDDDNLFHVGASSYTESAYDSHGDTQVANKALVAAGIAKLVNSAPAALDTLEELATALGDDAAFSTTVNTALGNRLRIDVNNQGLTSTELTNARTNLGLGSLATLNTVGASEITDGSVDTAELADDAVTAAKLDDDGEFTMGGLTVNGTGNLITLNSSIRTDGPSLRLSNTASSSVWQYADTIGSLEFHVTDVSGSGNKALIKAAQDATAGLGTKTYPNAVALDFYSSSSNALSRVLQIAATKKVGIGDLSDDEYVPSGTLHVSTARYGSHLITGDYSDYSVSDESASTASKYGWASYGDNTLAVTSEQLVVAYAGGTNAGSGAYRYIRASNNAANLVIGKSYKVSIDLKYSGSGSAPQVRVFNGSSYESSFGTLTTSLVTYTTTFEAAHASNAFIAFTALGSGQSITIDNLTIQEDTLSTSADITLHGRADDLLVNNNDHAGMTILSPSDKYSSIHFSRKGQNFTGAGVLNYLHSDDKFRFYTASGTPSLILGSDAKFGGAVGINGREASATSALEIKSISSSSATSGINIQSNSGNYSVVMLGEKSTEGGRLHLAEEGVNKISFYSDGTTNVINAGNVAIGGTTANSALQINYTPSSTTALRLSTSGTGTKTWEISEQNGTAGTLLFQSVTGTNVEFLSLEHSTGNTLVHGNIDHKANSIINSATVQGLQDGACYDFNGTNDFIQSPITDTLDVKAVSIWFKPSAAITNNTSGQWLICLDDSNYQPAIVLGSTTTSITNEIITVWDGAAKSSYASASETISAEWHHLVATHNATNSHWDIYLDGVAVDNAYNGTSNTKLTLEQILIGARADQTGNRFNGQIRDVKIFPSALDAADIRKLYSGENPKKNTNAPAFSDLNGEDWSGASGGTAPTGWTEGNAGTFSVTAGELTITRNADNPYIYKTFTVTSGDAYKISYRLKNVNASHIRVGLGSTAIGTQLGITDHSATSYTTYEKIVTATSTTLSVYVQVSTSTAGQNALIDFLRIESVGTLVDFNPLSASSTKWRNEALLGFYDGTVNNATLSQGNTYWNNIKQDGTDVIVQGNNLFIDSDSHAELKLDAGTTSVNSGIEFQVAGVRKGIIRYDHNATDTSANLDFYTGGDTSTSAFQIQGDGNVKVTDKLGVGHGSHGTHHLSVNGSSNFLGSLFLTNSTAANINAVTGHMGLYFDSDSNANVADRSFTIYNRAAAAFKIDGSSNVMIGTPASGAAAALFHITGAAPRIRFEDSSAPANYSQIGADNGQLTLTADGGQGQASSAIIANVDGSERFRIDGDGTQDHKGNRIVNSQTVNDSWRSSEPSLRFGGSNDYVTLPTASYDAVKGNQITVSAWIKRETDTNVYDGIVATSVNLADGFALLIGGGTNANITDKLFWQFDGTAGQIDGESGGVTIPLGEWTHVVGTYDGTTLKTYVNGVADRTSTSAGKRLDGSNKTIYIGAQEAGSGAFSGEIKDVRIHNRALDADEIRGLYNGESTPYKYANGGETVLALNDFSSSDMTGWNSTSEATNYPTATSGKITYFSTSGANYPSLSAPAMTLVEGRTYKVKFDIWSDDASNTDNVFVKIGKAQTGAAANVAGSDTVFDSNLEIDPTGSAVTYIRSFTAGESCTAYVVFRGGSSSTLKFNVDNISVVTEGEVAAYTPQSIGGGNTGSWFDTTSNRNHGAVSGATVVNPLKLGPMQIGGDYPNTVNIRYDAADSVPLQLNNRNKTNGDITAVRWLHEDGNSTGGYYPVELGTEIANANDRKADFKLWVSDTDNVDRSSDCRLHVTTAGDVKATSASGGLKQVARTGTSTSIGLIDGDGSKTHFSITHNLGTELVVVSVREKLTPFSFVEAEVRCGSWSDNSTMASNSQYDKITVIFATAPAANEDFYVTVIG